MSEDATSEALLEFLNAAEAGIAAAKRIISEAKGIKQASDVAETTFTCLKFDVQQGSRLGEFEVASKASNIVDKFSHAYGVLRASNATIKERYQGPDYAYSYWLYAEDKIYRQKIKRA